MDTKLLKQKILDLAIHGKLVPQNPNDESATVLLEKIRAEKAEKIKKGELKADKKDSFIFVGDDNRHYEKFADGTVKDIEDSIPFDLPNNWCWIRLQEIADIARGGSPRPIEDYLTNDESGINWIKIGDTKPGSKYIVSAKEKIKAEGKNHSRYVQAGDFLLTNSMSFGRPYILKIDGCIHDGWLVFANIKNCLLQDYLYHALSSKYIYDSFSLVAAGSTVKNLKSDTVKQVLFPLPPIDEQKRILEEIERIIEIIEKLDDDKMELSQAIIQTKSKILDLAIHGKLVPQDSSDEPASVLLEKLRAEKEAKIKAGNLKRDKNDSYIYKNTTDNCHYEKFADGTENDLDVPFELPDNWSWCRLPEICRKKITDGTHNSPPTTEKGEFLYITAKNIKDNKIDISNISYVTKEIHDSISKRCPVELNDILLTKDGTIGEVAINKLTCQFSLLSSVALIKPADSVLPLFLVYVLKSNPLQQKMKQDSKGVALKRIILEQINEFLIPVPPLNEQKRIVEKIEYAFTQLDEIALNLV